MTYEEFLDALGVLGLGERASMAEIKMRHRILVKRYHPDHSREENTTEMAARVNQAYRLVQAYCAEYRYLFSEEEFFEQNPEERLRRQFEPDPVWGGRKPPIKG